VSADYDSRLDPSQLQDIQTANPFSSITVPNPYVTADDDEAPTGGQTQGERDSLQRRIRSRQ
jgi:hypothetical protein